MLKSQPPHHTWKNRHEVLRQLLDARILVLDGAMGTMIQRYGLDERDFRGSLFRDHEHDLKGNNDILSLTQPHVIREIHEQYLEAGADIIETNTFNANEFSQADYGMEHLVFEMNRTAARIAAETAGRYTLLNPGKPRFVAGSIGPTNKSASISPDISRPDYRSVSFDGLYKTYKEQARGLTEGGADILLVETVFDTLNAKAALFAIRELFREAQISLPVIVSGTVTDAGGRLLTGQTVEAFFISVEHAGLLAIGLNCSLGAGDLRPSLEILSSVAPLYLCAYPNAGLPNQFGEYDETPESMAGPIGDFIREGLVNIVGGCCGTTPEHIRHFAGLAEGSAPRKVPGRTSRISLAGLEPLPVFPGSNFINIGERTNVSGSRRFAGLIREERYEEALSIARQQVENGAQMIDINMDDAMLDARSAMVRFLNLLASEPEIARVPLMIDSSRWGVIEAGLRCIQGKPVVNSISLKDGEKEFLRRAVILRDLGAAVIVMAFDEAGQADTFERKTAICQRAYELLTGRCGYPPHDIIFDPNILTVATGIEEHNNYAADFIRATKWIKEHLDGAHVSGGISNLSFSFRGNDTVREAMHAVFLYHAIRAGLDMGIVNAGMLPLYDEIPSGLRQLVEDVILNRRKDATGRLVAYAASVKGGHRERKKEALWRNDPVDERLRYALVRGIDTYVAEDAEEARKNHGSALKVIEGPLMKGMNAVGEMFGSGKMFLPQVVKSARVMKKAVSFLTPFLDAEKKPGTLKGPAGKILMATVRGDVHDIGKNIVGVVLGCNNYEVMDLGVMVPAERIVRAIRKEKPDIMGLSGLITPSLEEMVHVAGELERLGLSVPLLIGGATTSEVHTAVKIAPAYHAPVIHVRDASLAPGVCASILSSAPKKRSFLKNIREKYQEIRERYDETQRKNKYISLSEARKNRLVTDWETREIIPPSRPGRHYFTDYPISEISSFIDWTFFFHAWKIPGKYPRVLEDPVKGREARKLYDDAQVMLQELSGKGMLTANGAASIFPAVSSGDDVKVFQDHQLRDQLCTLYFLRNQQEKDEGEPNLCLSDYIAPEDAGLTDFIGVFAVTAGIGLEQWVEFYKAELDDYRSIMIRILSDRLAEAFAEFLHLKVRKEIWGYSADESLDTGGLLRGEYLGIRPAPGYPTCPDHTEKVKILNLLEAGVHTGIQLTENYAMYPAASVCGYYFAYPGARYFTVGKLGRDQIRDYSSRKGQEMSETERWLRSHLNYDK
ncbi:MAG: methionine synthase [Bacteroidales bacterium]|nr:methionine synthase [Bacteroidales bacterium]